MLITASFCVPDQITPFSNRIEVFFGLPSSRAARTHLQRRHAGDLLGVLRAVLVLQHGRAQLLVAGRVAARVDERLVLPALAQDHVHQRVHQHDVRVRPQRQMDAAEVLGVARGHGPARVDHDLLGLLRVHAVVEHRAGLVAVGARQQDRVGELEVAIGVQQRRGRAEVLGDARVLGVPLRAVVDRAHRHAAIRAQRRVVQPLRARREEQLGRGEVHLRREVIGAPQPDRGRPAAVERALDRVRDPVQRLVPAHPLERARPCRRAPAGTAAARSGSVSGCLRVE